MTGGSGIAAATFSLAAGALPAGISLSSGGVVSGTPTAIGVSSPTLKATYLSASAQRPYTFTVSPVTILAVGGYRTWSNGTVAASCNDYRVAKPGYSYQGATGDGTYRIDPDGAGPITPVDVHCDMTSTAGKGYSLLAKSQAASDSPTAEASCAVHGMQLFVPRTNAQFAAARAKLGTAYFAMMGIYPKTEGATCIGSNFSSTGCAGWGPKDGGAWFVQNGIYMTEPNGDNSLNGSMQYWYDAQGAVLNYNDIDNGNIYGAVKSAQFACSAKGE